MTVTLAVTMLGPGARPAKRERRPGTRTAAGDRGRPLPVAAGPHWPQAPGRGRQQGPQRDPAAAARTANAAAAVTVTLGWPLGRYAPTRPTPSPARRRAHRHGRPGYVALARSSA